MKKDCNVCFPVAIGDYSTALPKEYIGGHKTMTGIADDSNNLGGITGHLRAEGI